MIFNLNTQKGVHKMSKQEKMSPEIAAFENLDREAGPRLFLEIANYIPVSLEQLAADSYKRSSNHQLNQTLMFGTVTQCFPNVKVSENVENRQDFLQIALDEGFDVYVAQSEAGLQQPFRLADLVGQRTVLTISNLIKVPDPDFEQDRIVALGSIQRGQEILGRRYYNKSLDESSMDFKHQTPQTGTITYVNGGDKPFVRIAYNGMTITTTPGRLGYYSEAFPFQDDLYVGKRISFYIRSVEKLDKKAGFNLNGKPYTVPTDKRINLSGTLYEFSITRKPLLTSPLQQLKSLYLSHALCSAKIAKIDPVKGLLVEVVPSVQLKGYISDKLRKQIKGENFDQMDSFLHTPVTVEITRIQPNHETNFLNGAVMIQSIPNGFARDSNPKFVM